MGEHSSQEAKHGRAYIWDFCAILLHEMSKLRTSSEFQKGRKGAFPEEVTIIVRSIAEPTFDVLFLVLPCQAKTRSTELSPKTVSLAQVNGYSVPPSLPTGIAKVLKRKR